MLSKLFNPSVLLNPAPLQLKLNSFVAPMFGVNQCSVPISLSLPPVTRSPPKYVISVSKSAFVGTTKSTALVIFLASVAAYQLYNNPYLTGIMHPSVFSLTAMILLKYVFPISVVKASAILSPSTRELEVNGSDEDETRTLLTDHT